MKMYDLYCRLNNKVELVCSLEVHQSVENRQTKLSNAFNERTSQESLFVNTYWKTNKQNPPQPSRVLVPKIICL